jgi:hypothetical protein
MHSANGSWLLHNIRGVCDSVMFAMMQRPLDRPLAIPLLVRIGLSRVCFRGCELRSCWELLQQLLDD